LNPTTTTSQRTTLIDTSDDETSNAQCRNDGDYNPTSFAKMSISHVQELEVDLAKQNEEQNTEQNKEQNTEQNKEQTSVETPSDDMAVADTPYCTQVTTPIGVFDVPLGKCQHYRPKYGDMCPMPIRKDGFANYCNDHTKNHFTSAEDEERKQLKKKAMFLMQMTRHNDKQVEENERAAQTFVHCRTAHSISQKERKIANSTIKMLLQMPLNSTVPVVNSVPIAKPKPTVVAAPNSPPKKSIAKEQPKKL
jgi:hypothetical protein